MLWTGLCVLSTPPASWFCLISCNSVRVGKPKQRGPLHPISTFSYWDFSPTNHPIWPKGKVQWPLNGHMEKVQCDTPSIKLRHKHLHRHSPLRQRIPWSSSCLPCWSQLQTLSPVRSATVTLAFLLLLKGTKHALRAFAFPHLSIRNPLFICLHSLY